MILQRVKIDFFSTLLKSVVSDSAQWTTKLKFVSCFADQSLKKSA